MKQFFAVGLLLISASVVLGQTDYASAHAQAACTLTLAQSPDVSGLRLGMKPDEVLALFPGSRADKEVRTDMLTPASRLGVSTLTIKPGRYASKAKFPRVSAITLMLLDGRVITVNVSYDGPRYGHVDEFLGKFIEGKKLPAVHAWEAYVGMDAQLKSLNCRGFEIKVFAGGKNVRDINYVELTDVAARKRIRDRRAKTAGKNSTG
ncbi:MAG TPA: hypothetical protein VN256_16880 [Pyrinomonadaceae bacterium]|nr:hypothetical protein [Pyrinomonadaceae bacterium]